VGKERAFVDLTGRRFGRLLVLKVAGKDNQNKRVWECLCDCGNLTIVRGSTLVAGHTRSCGCYNRERRAETLIARITTHGKSADPIYYVWEAMKARCYNEKESNYKRYGARGIKVCKEWLKFENFYRDMGDPPKGYTLDRLNNNGNYCKKNCRWATPSEQARNRRTNTLITLGNKTKLLIEWLEEFKMSRETYYSRIKKSGLTPEQALLTPIDTRYSGDSKKRNLFTYEGKTQCVTVWSRESGIPASTLRQRIKKGYSPEQVMSSTSFTGQRSLGNLSPS